MNILKKIFKLDEKQSPFANRLHEKIHAAFENVQESLEDEQLIKIACMAGLLARVAYSDMDVKEEEKEMIQQTLEKKLGLESKTAKLVSQIAIDEIQELSGLEDYLYGEALIKILDVQERYRLLESLFIIAASDQDVSNYESEEIRIICKSLNLEQKHFLSARAKVKEYIGALRKD